jgi:eukaryotic-like serine/threonine-protein kinase
VRENLRSGHQTVVPWRRRVVEEDLPPEPPRRPPLGDPWPWLFLLLALVVAGLVALWWWQREEDDGDDRATTTVVVATTTDADTSTAPADTETETVVETEGDDEPGPTEVPDVVGVGHVEAGEQVEAEGLKADTYPVSSAEPRGTVVEQRPNAGTSVQEGTTVRLNVSLGDGPREAREVPDVTGPKESDARASARAAGFTVRTVDRDAPTPEEVGEVILQEPGAGATAPELTQITLYVGR